MWKALPEVLVSSSSALLGVFRREETERQNNGNWDALGIKPKTEASAELRLFKQVKTHSVTQNKFDVKLLRELVSVSPLV